MAVVTSCPDRDELRRLVLGELPEIEMLALDAHLSGCPACLRAIGELRERDALVDAVRAGPDTPAPVEIEAVAGLIERVKRLFPAGERPSDDTAGLLADADGRTAVAGESDGADETFEFLAPPQAPDELGRLGPYRVLQRLGAGGMGVVFLAEDPHLRRRVALKVLRAAGRNNAGARERFLREARAAASLDHDHVVHIYQVGEDRGVPYLAMQLLKGESLEERLRREGTLPVREVLRVGREIAGGLAAAHAHGLVHRDVKPGNVWLEGERGRVKILDFGLARAGGEDVSVTRPGTLLGTPAYMAPEQARGEACDHRCDLFSLGCALYETCTGALPFDGPNTMAVLSALATQHPKPPAEVNPAVPAGLSDLILRLLAKNPADRPESARAVAAAIEALEREQTEVPSPTNRPVATETAPLPVSRGRGRRWVPWVAVATVLFGALGYLYGAAVYRFTTNQGVIVVETDDPDVEVVAKQGGEVITIIDPKSKKEVTLKAGTYQLELVPGKDGLTLSTNQFTLSRGGKVVVTVRLEPKAPPSATPPVPQPLVTSPTVPATGRSPFDALRRESIPDYELTAAGRGHAKLAPPTLVGVFGDSRMKHWSDVRSIAFSPDGKVVASGGDGVVHLWDRATGNLIQALPREEDRNQYNALLFSPDGKTLAAGTTGSVLLWDVATGDRLHLRYTPAETLAFSPDGKKLAFAAHMHTATVLDVETWKVLHALEEKAVTSVAFTPAGQALAAGFVDGAVRVWDVTTGKVHVQFPFEQKSGRVAKLSPDGKLLAASGGDHAIRLWDIAARKERHVLHGHKTSIAALAFSPDGSRLASGGGTPSGGDFVVRLWDVGIGELKHDLAGHEGVIIAVAFGPDGKTLASGGLDDAVKLWDAAAGKEDPVTADRGSIPNFLDDSTAPLAVSPDGKLLATAGPDNTALVWDGTTGKVRHTLRGHKGRVAALGFSPDGKRLATGSDDSTAKVWDVEGGKQQGPTLQHGSKIRCLAFHPNAPLLVTGGYGTLKVWDAETNREVRILHGHTSLIYSLAFSPDGKTLGSGSFDGTARLWDGATGEARHTLKYPAGHVMAVAFSPDGKTLASGGLGASSIRLWDVSTGKEQRVLDNKSDTIGVAFSPDGRTLATLAGPGRVRLWDADTGAERAPLTPGPTTGGARGNIAQIIFAPDGRHLLTLNGNGTVYVLRLAPPPADPNRKVAEWLLTRPAPTIDPNATYRPVLSFAVKLPDGTRVNVAKLSDLPPGPFTLFFIKATDVPFGDDDVTRLADELPHFGHVLWVSGNRYSDAGIRSIARLTNLEHLTIGQAKLTDEQLRLLTPLSKLTWLVIAGNPLTDAGLKHLAAFPKLERLEVDRTGITDAGLKHLEGLPALKDVRLQKTKVTEAGVKKLAAARPECRIEWDGGVIEPKAKPAGSTPFDNLKREDVPADELKAAGGGFAKLAPPQLVAVFGDSRLKHWADARAVAFTPDNTAVITAGIDGTVRVWDRETGRELRMLDHFGGHFHAVALSPDGKTLAAGSTGAVILWDYPTGDRLATLYGAGPGPLAFSPDSKSLAVGSDRSAAKVFDPRSREVRHELKDRKAAGVTYTPDGTPLAAEVTDTGVTVWDVASGKEKGRFAQKGAKGPVAFSPDGKLMAVSGPECGVSVWDVATGTERRTLAGHGGASASVGALAFSPDGKALAVAENGLSRNHLFTAWVWDVTTGEEVRACTGHTGAVGGLAFSPDGKTIASVGHDNTVRLWSATESGPRARVPFTAEAKAKSLEVATGKETLAVPGHQGSVLGVAVSPDGKLVATAGQDHTVRVWDVATGRPVHALTGHTRVVTALAFSPDGAVLASGSYDSTVRRWDVATGEQRGPTLRHSYEVEAVAFSPVAPVLVTGGLSGVRVWDTETSKELPHPTEPADAIAKAVAVSPDGKRMAAGYQDRTVRVWEVPSARPEGFAATVKLVHTLEGSKERVAALAFSPDSKTLASGTPMSGEITLWDVEKGTVLRTVPGGRSVAFSVDGRLVTVLNDGKATTVRVWNPAGSAESATIPVGPSLAVVHQVVFTPDGRHLVTANGSGTVYVLRLAPDAPAPK